MRKYLLTLATLVTVCTSVFAQLNGDGYYRVQNEATGRYVKIADDKGKLYYTTQTADLGAIKTIKGFNNVESDPGTIIYIEKVGEGYNLKSQGTDVYSIISYYTLISKSRRGNTYQAYASSHGFTVYIADGHDDEDEGYVVSNSSDTRDWYIKPVTDEPEQYFGIKPEYMSGENFYTSFYASFPFSFLSEGMEAGYITKVDTEYGIAVWKDITGEVPAKTPVIVKASSFTAAKNKLDIHTSAAKAPSGNLLKGVFFNNPSKTHYNRTAYDPNTMRMLGTISGGAIGFKKVDLDYIPENKAYLSVPEGTSSELRIMKESDYVAYIEKMEEEKRTKVQSITLDHDAVTLTRGETVTLQCTFVPEEAKNKTLVWSSTNETVATVADGTITAVKAGKATIYATTTDGTNLTAGCEITVINPMLTLKADDQSRTYGENNPTLTFTLQDAPEGITAESFTQQPTLTTTANKQSNAGTYAILISGGELEGFDLNYVNGTLTVNKAKQSITGIEDGQSFEMVLGGSLEFTVDTDSKLPLTASSSNATIVGITSSRNNYTLFAYGEGTASVTFAQDGNNNYEAAQTVVISVKVTNPNKIEAVTSADKSVVIYDMLGRKVENTSDLKGIFIVNGKKMTF